MDYGDNARRLTLYGWFSNFCSGVSALLLLLRHGDGIMKRLPRTLVMAEEIDRQWRCLESADRRSARVARGAAARARRTLTVAPTVYSTLL
jgi:hypothetical protein